MASAALPCSEERADRLQRVESLRTVAIIRQNITTEKALRDIQVSNFRIQHISPAVLSRHLDVQVLLPTHVIFPSTFVTEHSNWTLS